MQKRKDFSFSEIKRTRSRKQKVKRAAISAASGAALLGFFFWLVFASPVFRVSAIEVRGAVRLSRDAVRNAVTQELSGTFQAKVFGLANMLAWFGDVSSLDGFPQIGRLALERHFASRRVEIVVEERAPLGVWCAAGEKEDTKIATSPPNTCAWFDKEGIAFEEAAGGQGSLLTVVKDYTKSGLILGERVIDPRFFPHMQSILSVISEIHLPREEIRLRDASLQEVEVSNYGGPTLYFSLRFPSYYALPVLQKVLADPASRKLKYIDFRVENRAYYQ